MWIHFAPAIDCATIEHFGIAGSGPTSETVQCLRGCKQSISHDRSISNQFAERAEFMEPHQSTLERALRSEDVRSALAAAHRWAKASKDPAKETAIEIAKTVGTVYRDLVTESVHQFVESVETALPPEMASIVSKAVGRLINMTNEWEDRLRACYEERLARELRDFVREKEWQSALANIRQLCVVSEHEAKSDAKAAVRRRALYVGNVLGTCLNHPKEADHVIGMLSKEAELYGLEPSMIPEMLEARKNRHAQMMSGSLDNLENQWSSILNGTHVEMINRMPGKNKMNDPEESDLRDVGDLFRTILRIPLWRKRPEMLTDATLLLVDFVPKELGIAAKSSGIEGRSYAQIGFCAKKTVALVFMEIGNNSVFAKQYLKWANDRLEAPEFSAIVDLMGAMRSDKFAPFFMHLWNSKNHKHLRPELLIALSNLASPESAHVLLEELSAKLSTNMFTKRTVDAKGVREAQRVLNAIGRVVRSPRTPDVLRDQIILRVHEMVPRDHLKIAQSAVMDVFAARPQALSKETRQWAISILIDALWVQDQSTMMHKGGERQSNILGDRHALAVALKSLGKADFDHLRADLEIQASRYSGAFMAVADILQEIGDPRCLPVLDRMAMTTLMFDVGSQSSYQKETYWDSTTQERKPLNRDQILAPIIFAIGTIGGEAGYRSLKKIHTTMQDRAIQLPGNESLTFLARFLKELDAFKPIERADGPTPLAEPPAPGQSRAQQQMAAALPKADPAEVKSLIKAITGSYFLRAASTRAQAIIKAQIRLAQITPPEALPAIFKNLNDKDPMVSSAATTTLIEYGSPGKPAPLVQQVLANIKRGLESRDISERRRCLKVLQEMGPNRPDIRPQVVEMSKTVSVSEMQVELKRLLGHSVYDGAGAPMPAVDSPSPGSGVNATPNSGEAPKPAMVYKTELDLKREYMQARKEWIANGKKGNPPAPPPGM